MVIDEALLDFNENPLGPPPEAVRLIVEHAHELHRYPRGLHERASAAVAEFLRVDADAVLLTAGVDAATDLLLLTAGRAWCFRPGFNGYWHRGAALGTPVHRLPLSPDWLPTVRPSTFDRSGVLLVAQPANPTGNVYPRSWLRSVCRSPILVCVDETYVDFSARETVRPWLAEHDNLVVFVSFSKLFGLAGLRIGALVGSPALIARLRQKDWFYPVDTLSLYGLIGSLTDRSHLDDVVRYVRQRRPEHAAVLLRCPALFDRVVETEANFCLARCVTTVDVQRVVAYAGRRRVRLRDCAAFGLAGWLRISVGSPTDFRALEAMVQEMATEPDEVACPGSAIRTHAYWRPPATAGSPEKGAG